MFRIVNRACEFLAAAELPLVLLIAPALLFPTPARLALVILVLASWTCHWYLHGRLIPATPANLAIGVLVAMAGVSMLVTFDVRFSLGKVSGVVLGVLLFWAGTRWVNSAARLALATGAFVLAGAALATLGLLGTNWFSKFQVLGVIAALLPSAIRGVPGAEEGFHPNPVAGSLLLFIPVQIALLRERTRHEVLSWCNVRHSKWDGPTQGVLLLLTVGTLLLTQSRGAWAATVAAALAFLFWRGGRSRITAAVAIAATAVTATAVGPQRLFDLAISQAGPATGNLAGRVDLWSKAIQAIGDYPLTGMGMNTFREAMPVLYPTSLSLYSPDVDVAHAHNHLLQAALDLGLPGLVAYAALWMVAGMLLVRVYRRASGAHRALAGGLGAGLIAHFVFGITDAIPLGAKVGVLFWLTLALVVSLHQVALTSNNSPESRL